LFREIKKTQEAAEFLAENFLPTVGQLFKMLQDWDHKFAFDEESHTLAASLSFPDVDTAAVAAAVRPLSERQDAEEIQDLVGQLAAEASNRDEFRRLLRDFLVAVRHLSLPDPVLNQLEHQRKE
jgi:hypothetical protein